MAQVQRPTPIITLHMESELTAFKGFVGNYVSGITRPRAGGRDTWWSTA